MTQKLHSSFDYLETPYVSITEHYANGGSYIREHGHITYVKYNTGDQIWLGFIDGVYQVTKVITYDGIDWGAKFGLA